MLERNKNISVREKLRNLKEQEKIVKYSKREFYSFDSGFSSYAGNDETDLESSSVFEGMRW